MRNDPLVEILKKNFEHRKARNKAYSLRSFSRDLGLDPSNLSKILSYQKEVGSRLRLKLGKLMGFETRDVEGWLKPTLHSKTANQDYAVHDLQVFEIVSEWQHYAFLEYFKMTEASQNPKVIAEHLGIPLKKAEESLGRLLATGLLVKTKEGYKAREDSSSSILNTATSKAHREQQKQILEGAIDALENIPLELRSQSSITMAVDSRKLNQARELIKNFRRDLGRLMSTSNHLDHVYQLSISLYPVTQTKNKKGEKR